MGPEDPVPGDEEGLREVVLVAVELVVDVVVGAVVAEEHVEDVPREAHPAVVVHGLDGGEGEEEDARSGAHAGGEERDGPADGVEQEALHRVVVEGPEGVWDDQHVVLGVDVLVQELVDVHVPVHEVLPGVQNHHRHHHLGEDHQQGRLRPGRLAVVLHQLQ